MSTISTASNHNDQQEAIRLLHVDDDPDLADLTATFLTREDDRFDIEIAHNVSEGLDRLAETEFDCIVSDYDMPGKSGIEFLEIVREDYPELPFILFTGKGGEEVASAAISAGVTDYLQKERGPDQYTILANRIINAVSAHHAATEAARVQQQLDQILKTVPACIVQLNYDGEFIFANERAVEVLGLERSQVTDRAYNDPEWEIRDLDGNPIPDEELPFRQVCDSGEALYGYRHTIRWSEGTRKELLVNGAPLLDEGGNTKQVVFALSDITDHKERTRDLQQSKARLGALFRDSPDMINVHDIDGTILEVNAQFCEETGYNEDDLVGMRVWELDQMVDPDDIRALWMDMEPGDRRELEGVYQRHNGSTFPVKVHIRQLARDEGERFVVISRDVTEEKERERQLEQRNEQLENFASIVSHDLRNPLNVAEGRLALGREECDSEHFETVADAHGRMDALIEDLLTLAKEGDRISDTEPVDLAELSQNCWQNVKTTDAKIQIHTNQTIQADKSRLAQLLENLIRNAIEHGHGDMKITIGELEDGFYIEDNGPGISEDERDHVFEAGYSTSDGGTGFGLSIVEQVAGAHGWNIRVTDGTEDGARFEITGVEFTAE